MEEALMSHTRAARVRMTLIGTLLGVAGIIGLTRLARRPPRRRPTADEIMRMDDDALIGFVRSKGLRTATDLESPAAVGTAD
jgi:hypothetical protein